MTESQKHSKAQKLLSEYRSAVWRKSALEAVPGTGRKALYACIEQMRFTEGLVEALRNTRLLGEKLYWVVYATYMTERQPGDVNEILDRIAKNHEYINIFYTPPAIRLQHQYGYKPHRLVNCGILYTDVVITGKRFVRLRFKNPQKEGGTRMSVLKTQNLTKLYNGKAAVDNVSVTVEKGDIFGLIGQNGAGKTTFMRMVTSLVKPTSGSIELFGEREESKLKAARSRIGSVIETPALFDNLSAVKNLEYYRRQRGITEKNRVQECLEIAGLTDTGKKKYKNFSLGMKQRLGLALAILSCPDFLVLDEPTNGLDPTGIIEMRDLIKRLSKEGVTILVSSHILSELAQMANKYAIIHKGRLIKNITHAQLQEECSHALAIVVDDPAKAAVVLERQLGVKEYRQISANEIRVYEYLNDPAKVNFQLIQHGIQVSSTTQVGDSLEEYFTKAIGGAE